MSKVFHIGDLHLDHKNISKFRNVSSTEENNELLVDNILTVTTKRDTLWLHGDIFFTLQSVEKYLPVLAGNVGYLHLILGNHDLERVTSEDYNKGMVLIHELCHSVSGLVKHKKCWLSHAPLHPDELRGSINIHGHVHQHTVNDERYVNVSVDNTGFFPINRQDILAGWRGLRKPHPNLLDRGLICH